MQLKGTKNIRFLMLHLAIIILAGSPSIAQVYPEVHLQQALENNPGLKAMKKAWEASLEQVEVSGALPDPLLSAGFFTPPMDRFMGTQWIDVGLMQMLPWFGTLGKQKNVAEKMAGSAYHRYRAERNSLFMELTRMWLEITRGEQELLIIRKNMDVLETRDELIHTRYRSGLPGSGIALDIYRLEISLADLQNRENKLMEDLAARRERFNLLTGRDAGSEIQVPASLPEPQSGQWSSSVAAEMDFAGNAMLNLKEDLTEAARAQQELSRLQTRPMLGIGLQYAWFAPGQADMGQMEGGHMLMPMISVSLPVFRNKNQAIHRQSQLRAESARYNTDDQLIRLQSQWITLQTRLETLGRDRDFYGRQLVLTEKTMELAENAYASGGAGFDEFLDILDQLIDLEWRIVKNEIDRLITLAEMEMLAGRGVFE